MKIPYFDPIVRLFWEGECRGTWHEGPRRIYDCLLDYVAAGEYVLVLESITHVLKAGDLIIVPPGIRSEGRLTPSRRALRRCIHFSWNHDYIDRHPPLQTPAEEPFNTPLSHAVPPAIARTLPLRASAREDKFIAGQLEVVYAAIRGKSEHSGFLLWPLLRHLLASSKSTAEGKTGGGSSSGKAVLDVKSFIETHYFEEIGYREFCDTARMSESYLCQAFQRIVGIPPATYLNEVRLQHARRLIVDESLSIKQAARTVGIRDQNYFARMFRKRFGMSPSQCKASS
jgi:AraC-like DNA-binding protein